MKNRRLLSLLLVCGLALTGIGGCEKKQVNVRAITPSEAYGLLRNGFGVVIDVRELSALRDGVIYDCRNVPSSKIQESWESFVTGLPKDKQIMIIGDERSPSEPVARKLVEAGMQALDLGRYGDWVKAGLPIKRP